MIHIYAGWDQREEIGYHAFTSSVIHNASEPVTIAPIRGDQRDGSNAFTYGRFGIPKLHHYSGWAVFMDGSDMICIGDVAELYAMRDYRQCVQVVHHDYKTKHPLKYVGTSMEAANEDYPRKNWSSVMLINCGHPDWRKADPSMPGAYLHRFEFTDRIGALPVEWNWLVDEFGPNDKAKLLHWTAGIPAFNAYCGAPMKEAWYASRVNVNHVAR